MSHFNPSREDKRRVLETLLTCQPTPPGCGGAHLPPLRAQLPRQGSLQSTGQISGLQSILCLVPASTMAVTLIPISMLYAEPFSPLQQAPAKKLALRTRLSVPAVCCWGTTGACGQTGRSCGSAGKNHCTVLIRRNERVLSSHFGPPCCVHPSQPRHAAL